MGYWGMTVLARLHKKKDMKGMKDMKSMKGLLVKKLLMPVL
jgi:hypothetical protein